MHFLWERGLHWSGLSGKRAGRGKREPGAASHQRRARSATQTGGKVNLTHRETEALDALCDTFVPSLVFEQDEDPALFSMSAADLGVSARVAAALEIIEPA